VLTELLTELVSRMSESARISESLLDPQPTGRMGVIRRLYSLLSLEIETAATATALRRGGKPVEGRGLRDGRHRQRPRALTKPERQKPGRRLTTYGL
jgi:hypothetical protein